IVSPYPDGLAEVASKCGTHPRHVQPRRSAGPAHATLFRIRQTPIDPLHLAGEPGQIALVKVQMRQHRSHVGGTPQPAGFNVGSRVATTSGSGAGVIPGIVEFPDFWFFNNTVDSGPDNKEMPIALTPGQTTVPWVARLPQSR